jgi:hypothetical protein
MSSSGRTTVFRRWLHRNAPWLFQVCMSQNYHWRWDSTCHCMAGCNGFSSMPLHESVQRRKEGRYKP